MSELPNREVVVLNAALELRPEERAAYLDQACAGEAALRRRVEELLQAHTQAEGFLEAPPAGLDFKRTIHVSLPPTEKPGDRIGRYKLLQQIGEGGCGIVYMAEQEEPVRRRVALKVIKLGMDTKQVIARFEAERQALALMDHPNITKVLDAGATDTGRPYFVMELVRGVKITDFCDENKLSTGERLKLFIQVCQAVQHAHQKGVIHRDLKPSNILVTVNDDEPVPKVIDFGIAKATQGRLTDQTLFTAFEQFMGTPAYMSPEQAVMTSLDIDTRTDIYSLGVLLYELLTGRTPFDQRELLAAGLDEMRRTIREKEPARPSTRLSKLLAAELTTTARQRKMDAPKLIHFLRGDLDCIVMKCLEKDRKRRYETVNGLAMDTRRFLEHQPVVARPPSSLYRFQKLVRRNRLAFAAVGLIALSLAVGTYWEKAGRVLVQLYQLVISPEVVIAEVDFKSKEPQFYGAFSYDGVRGTVASIPAEVAGAGLRGGSALVARFDTSYFTNQAFAKGDFSIAGFGTTVTVPANAANWINTTNLGAYKLYVTARTAGLTGSQSHGRVQWQFVTRAGVILTLDSFATFTTNYQDYSFVIGDGSTNPYSGGSWNDFVDHFHEIDRVQCAVGADNWRGEYRLDEEAAFYISNVKFVRLTRPGRGAEIVRPEPAAGGAAPRIQIQPMNQTVKDGRGASFSVLAAGSFPLTWQWRHGMNLLLGETNATLTLRNVTPAEAGIYSVLITNAFGAVASSNSSLTVLQVREVTIAEVNFQDKWPMYYSVYTYCQNPVPLATNAAVVPDAGLGGGPALVARANGSGFSNRMDQAFAGFGTTVTVAANSRSGIDTTNLDSYKLYVTARTAGLNNPSSHGRVQWWFLTPAGVILTVDQFATFTTNYRVYSFVLADGSLGALSGGSWNEFVGHFNEIDRIQCALNADDWLKEYRLDQDAGFYISHVKFVRLVPAADPQPAGITNSPAMPEDAGRNIGS